MRRTSKSPATAKSPAEPKLLAGRVPCRVASVTDDAVFIDVGGQGVFRMTRSGGSVPFSKGQELCLRFELKSDQVRAAGPQGVV